MRVVTIIAIAFLFFSVLTGPFSAAADQPSVTTFKGQSNLVLIPTVVHDKSGAHIPNLTKTDFTVTCDGEKRVVAVFEEVRPGDRRVQKAAARADEFTNLVTGELRPNRLTVIALDTVTTPELRQQKMFATSIRQEIVSGLPVTRPEPSYEGIWRQ
jgi:hypothetical protein